MTTPNLVATTLAEYGFTPDADLPVLYHRPSDHRGLYHVELAEHGTHSLSLWPSAITHSDPVVAVHTLMALSGIARVEVKP
jgi:hypothetical protein